MDPTKLPKKQIAEIKKAVNKLSSKKAEERQVAQLALDALGASKFDVLLALLKQEAAGRRTRRRWVISGFTIYFVLLIVMMITPLFLGKKPEFGFLGQFGSMTGAIMGALAVTATQKNATSALAEFDDVRAVGWWALALGYDDKQIVAQAREKLTKLLPGLTASDGHLLDAEQRAALHKALSGKDGSAELHKSILDAVAKIGDLQAIPAVEKLARGEGASAHLPVLQAAASECLAALHVRAEQDRASASLLRASSFTEVPEAREQLLRPASAQPAETAPAELLRAAGEDAQPAALHERQLLSTTPEKAETPATLTQR